MPTQDIAELIISCKTKNIEEVERVTKEVDKADKAANKLLKTLGNLVSAAAIFKVFKGGVQEFIRLEDAANALDAAFRRIGKTNAAYRRELADLNAELAKNSIYTTAELAAAQALALNMGVSGDKIKETTQAAIGLSAAYGKDLGSSMRMLALAASGNYISLKYLGIQVDKNLSPAENYSNILKQLSGNMDLAKARTQTVSGALTQMNKSVDDAKAALGEQLAPYIRETAGLIGGLADKFANAEPETKRFVTVMGTVTMGMLALKSAIGLKAIADNLSGVTGVAASTAKQKATKEEIALEKALQKEKLANIALEQAKGKVAAAKSAVAMAESKRNDAMKRPVAGGRVNLDAVQTADNGVTAAKEQLAAAEKELQKLTAAHNKAANGVELLKTANEKSIPVIDNRLELEKKVAAAEKASEKAATALGAADERAAAARIRLNEARRGVKETFADWRRNPEDQDAYTEVRYQNQNLAKAKADYAAARSEVAKLEKGLDKANAAVIAANAELKALGPTAETVSAEMQKLGTTTTTTNAGLKTLGTNANVATAGLENMGFSAAASGKQMTFMRRQFTTFPTFARGARAASVAVRGLGVALRGAALAAKSLMVSMLPMLAVSAAIAGIDYLLNRAKVAADKQNAKYSEMYDLAIKSAEGKKQEREEINRHVETLELLSKYSNLTTEEQKQALEAINALSQKYPEMADGIQLVNGKLVVQADLFKKLTAAQKEQYVKSEERNRKAALGKANSLVEGFGKKFGLYFFEREALDKNDKFNNYSILARSIDYWASEKLGFNTDIQKNIGNKKEILDMVAKGGTARWYEGIASEARKNGLTEMAEEAEKIAKSLREADTHAKNVADANKAGKIPDEKRKGESKNKIEDSTKALADFAKARESLESKKWSIEYDLANPEGKTDMLQKKIDDLAKRRDDALERAPNDRKKQTEAIQLSEKMIDLEKQKAAIMQDADNKRVEDMKKAAKEEEEFLQWAMKATSSLKDTTQNAIDANSIDAVRMQSRSLEDGGGGLLSAAQNAANAAKAATDAAAKSVRIQQQMKSVIDNIYAKLANLGTSSVG